MDDHPLRTCNSIGVVAATLLLVAAALAPRAVDATESIGVFADPYAIGCELDDENWGFIPEHSYYVVHMSTSGASGSRWKAEVPACAADGDGIMFAADIEAFDDLFTYTGGSQTGIQVDYGQCVAGAIYALEIWTLVRYEGYVPSCCMWPVTPDPAVPSAKVVATDCDGHKTYPVALEHPINPDGSCPCGTVPVEHTTWGGVKALWSTEN